MVVYGKLGEGIEVSQSWALDVQPSAAEASV